MVKLTVPLRDGRIMTFEGTEKEVMNIGKAYENCSGTVTTPAQVEIVHWTPGAARTLMQLLYGDQAKFIKFLIRQAGIAKYADVQKHMGYGGQKLAGVLSSITRNAQKATGMDSARAVGWRGVPGNYEYLIDPKALPFLRDVELRERVAAVLKSAASEWMSVIQISDKVGTDIGPYSRILGPMEADGEIVLHGEPEIGVVRWRQEAFEIVTNAAPFLDPEA